MEFFIFFFSSFKKNIKFYKHIFYISIFLIPLLLISKTHDDFSYYHYPFTKFLTENHVIFGMGHLNLGYNFLSSLFFLNSSFYLPFIKLFSFHYTAVFFLLFFNYFFFVKYFLIKLMNTLGTCICLVLFFLIYHLTELQSLEWIKEVSY